MMILYEKTFVVTSTEVDALGNIQIDALQKRIQGISDEHGYLLGFGFEDMDKIGLFWVVSRLMVTIYQLPKENDMIRIMTWLTAPSAAGINRYYQLFDSSNNILCEGVAKWSLVYRESLKLAKIQSFEFISSLQFTEKPLFESDEILKKIPISHSQKSISVVSSQVQKDELDFNNHVNNTIYIKYLVNLFEIKQEVIRYQINYIEPLYEFETFRIECFLDNNLYFYNAYKTSKTDDDSLSFQAIIQLKE